MRHGLGLVQMIVAAPALTKQLHLLKEAARARFNLRLLPSAISYASFGMEGWRLRCSVAAIAGRGWGYMEKIIKIEQVTF